MSQPHSLRPAIAVSGPACDPARFGAHLCGDGVDVVVNAPEASRVQFCVEPARRRGGPAGPELELLPAQGGRWHAHISGLDAGTRYGLRADGPWEPAAGLRFNRQKLLLDPYARGITGQFRPRHAVLAHALDHHGAPLLDVPDHRDSAPDVPHGVVVPTHWSGPQPQHPRIPWSQTVIYEAHVVGLTKQLAAVPEHLRGTYAGLAHPATISQLRALGVTAVELLPIHAKLSEPQLLERGLENYWGYNTLNFFSPEPSYATSAAQAQGPAAVLDEVRGMVHLLHEAGIEVILDVVYNHTAEAGQAGPTLSWRGLDDDGYYLHGERGQDVLDYTGCGNTLDFRHERVVQMCLDSLRYWVEVVGVDGFRFDLAVTLGRENTHFTPRHPFLMALATDPVLSACKLIAEPWDLGPDGWQTGHFPAPLAEWNDRFRDAARAFWLEDRAALAGSGPAGDVRELATRLAGSADMFAHQGPTGTAAAGGRGPTASINYVTAHDGFTLADLVSYDHKHNEANGEDNRDGTSNNRSYNHGHEGPDDGAAGQARQAARRQSMRNLLGTLLLSSGTAMLTGGDEIGRTQGGNNNAYCLNDPLTWVNWDLEPWQEDLRATTAHLLRLRARHPSLRPWRFPQANTAPGSDHPPIAWFNPHGQAMEQAHWPGARTVQMWRAHPEGGALLVINGSPEPVEVTLAAVGPVRQVWDSTWEHPDRPHPLTSQVAPWSLRLYLGGRPD